MHHYNTSLDGYTLTSKGLAHLEVLCAVMTCTPAAHPVQKGSQMAPEGPQKGSIRIIREMWGIRITPPTPLNDTFRGGPLRTCTTQGYPRIHHLVYSCGTDGVVHNTL